jgi:cytochrome c biogenesis protein CcmG/thiol:disulfide interchange protein DsbE
MNRPLVRNLLYLVPAIAFGAIAVYLWSGLDPERDPRIVPSALIDKPAPQFDLPPLHEGAPRLTSADLDGPLLLNFFASWCVPCRGEHPLLMRLAKDEGLTLYGIAYKDDPEKSRAFLAELGDPFGRIGVDRDGRAGIDFGVSGVPETFLIDRQGIIRYRQWGPLDRRILEEDILPRVKQLQP